MKKSALILLMLVAGFSTAAMAEDMDEMQAPPDRQQDGRMGGDKSKMKGHMMMGMQQKPTMLATPDGGVIILSGHTLSKYDANLDLVREVELKKDKKMPPPPAEPAAVEAQPGPDAPAESGE